jgi:hypothetical protein
MSKGRGKTRDMHNHHPAIRSNQGSERELHFITTPVPQYALHYCGVRHRHALFRPSSILSEMLQAVKGEKERPEERVGGRGGFDAKRGHHEQAVEGRGPHLNEVSIRRGRKRISYMRHRIFFHQACFDHSASRGPDDDKKPSSFDSRSREHGCSWKQQHGEREGC